MTGNRGWAMMDALVSLGLAGVAIAGVAGAGGLALRVLRVARDTNAALGLASDRVEALRAGPRANGSDATTASDGTVFTRTWQVTDGRGQPTPLSVDVQTGGRTFTLKSEVFP